MTMQGSDTPNLTPLSGVRGGEASEISLTRIYLPFAMVVTFGAFLVIAGYTAGGFMSGIAHDKAETDSRLSAIEKEVTAIKNILAERAALSPPCNCRSK
ncbi:MAG TPA: hypothetical protein VE986_10230 [Hyphomicrobiales bacterium]|nr:hypothetical protein [Hyphomicrobiales bacterium]